MYFSELSGVDSFLSMSLGLSAAQSIRTISLDLLFLFFLELGRLFFVSTVLDA